jgi:hypothetical protein
MKGGIKKWRKSGIGVCEYEEKVEKTLPMVLTVVIAGRTMAVHKEVGNVNINQKAK